MLSSDDIKENKEKKEKTEKKRKRKSDSSGGKSDKDGEKARKISATKEKKVSLKERSLPPSPNKKYRVTRVDKNHLVVTYNHNYLKLSDDEVNTSGHRYQPCGAAEKYIEINKKNWHVINGIYQNRIACKDNLKVAITFPPGTPATHRKICVVVSIGCPYTLTKEKYLSQLHWYAKAKERSTYLLVHSCELETYQAHCTTVLQKGNVGLAVWICGDAVGFGLTRRAAQILGHRLRPDFEVVICDSNVGFNEELSSGYETDDSERERRKTPLSAHLYSPGLGGATPTLEWTSTKTGRAHTGDGRPIEQVTVGSVKKFLFDPAFITSNEDIALSTLCYPGEEDWQRHKLKEQIRKYPHQASNAPTEGDQTNKYALMRTHYLSTVLIAEDSIPIFYRWRKTSQDPWRVYKMTLKSLTEHFATIHPNRSRLIVRSTIIEILLVCWQTKGFKQEGKPIYLTASVANWDGIPSDLPRLPAAEEFKFDAVDDEGDEDNYSDDEKDPYDRPSSDNDDAWSEQTSEQDDEESLTRQQREMRAHSYGYYSGVKNHDDDEEEREDDVDSSTNGDL